MLIRTYSHARNGHFQKKLSPKAKSSGYDSSEKYYKWDEAVDSVKIELQRGELKKDENLSKVRRPTRNLGGRVG